MFAQNVEQERSAMHTSDRSRVGTPVFTEPCRTASTPAAAAISRAFLRQTDVARRWWISERTLEGWRSRGLGPRYVKVGGRVVYRLADIEAFEAQQTRG
jgi:hypothetical protein